MPLSDWLKCAHSFGALHDQTRHVTFARSWGSHRHAGDLESDILDSKPGLRPRRTQLTREGIDLVPVLRTTRADSAGYRGGRPHRASGLTSLPWIGPLSRVLKLGLLGTSPPPRAVPSHSMGHWRKMAGLVALPKPVRGKRPPLWHLQFSISIAPRIFPWPTDPGLHFRLQFIRFW